jgi:inner membrane protein
MRARTHLIISLLFALLFLKIFAVQNKILFVVLALIASFFPDIDEKHSWLGRRTRIISEVFKHRGFFHSFYAMILLSLLVYSILGLYAGIGFLLGYLIHLLTDMLTPMGVKPFMFGKRIKGPIRTGGAVEWVLFFIFLILDVALIFTLL